MSSSADKINELFWLNYAQKIQEKAGANLGQGSAFFVASETQQGPPGGDDIPDAYTNQGLYDICNNLLAADDLFYTPSAQHGYIQALNR
ncbi:hypothetical protein PG985_009683 [Apiospora marii]|uniref:Uncharacterized protein n=1 Tax=Apiospora marii TaxID=335849 RepID=A0ABR1RI27_9PEZI